MKGKLFILLIVIAAFSLWNHRNKNFTHDKYLHYPTLKVNFNDQNASNLAKKGVFNHQVSLSFAQKIQRKRINNYLFVLDNQIKIQVALIDLTYISLINVNYFSKEHTFSFEREIMFSLPENFNDRSFEYSKKGDKFAFSFRSEQIVENNITKVVSHFDIIQSKNQNFFTLQLEHIQPSNRCVTYLRNGVVSYKCYGGVGSGEYKIQIKNQENKNNSLQNYYKQSQQFNLDQSTVAFDGFRASGWLWQWVWGMGSGVSEDGRHISINFGTVRGIGEDVIHIDDKIIPLVWIDYSLNENITVGNSFQLKSIQPQMQLVFNITAKQHKYRDMLLFKNDMIKFQGYWSGYFIDPDTNEKIDVKRLVGLVQTADSIF